MYSGSFNEESPRKLGRASWAEVRPSLVGMGDA